MNELITLQSLERPDINSHLKMERENCCKTAFKNVLNIRNSV